MVDFDKIIISAATCQSVEAFHTLLDWESLRAFQILDSILDKDFVEYCLQC